MQKKNAHENKRRTPGTDIAGVCVTFSVRVGGMWIEGQFV